MATLLLAAGGQFIGGALGGPIGATIGRALGAMAGNVLDDQLFGQTAAPTQGETYLLNAKEGQPIPRIYGWTRIAGNVIWATELERLDKAGGGLKSIGAGNEDAFAANFAIGLCEGAVPHIGRIWADGKLMDMRGVNYRFYSGEDTQMPDSLIEAKQGAGNAPAYRGLAYLVFEQLDLTPYGNRIPQISVELCRPVGDVEKRTKAVCLIPGATEFGYDPVPRVRLLGNGSVISENSHQTAGKSDWEVSVDELTALCPNLEHVALVISWFGNDLRCGNCTVTPRVMGHDRNIKDTEWNVAGLSRAEAELCSQVDGGPAYGGTPSDNSVIAAIKDLKSRGLKVTIYPLMMMDIPAGNQLPDPYSDADTQANHPWRGRITCDPAIGRPGTADQTSLAAAQVQSFVGNASAADFDVVGENISYNGSAEWSYRRYILHCASLAKVAGGVDAFIVGSEMVALSTVRDGQTSFPFVDQLKSVTGDVRAIVGAYCKLTYAADWTEYHGYQPADAPGDKLFHLDPLWSDINIDAIGIDNYMPLSDWRDYGTNSDSENQSIVHDLEYLRSNIAGGEGFDWYYASNEDREAQNRTPITDGEHNEPWVWRYKDLKNWWQNPHHNRVAGVRSATPTDWVPQSRSFWLTEVGCGAVGNGANQPNAFTDPKSADNKSPYNSNGLNEPAIQRQFLRAHYEHWQTDASGFSDEDNPVSDIDGRRMLDPERVYLWAWDARPFPAFPLRDDVWSDGPSYYTGHWTTGRFGCATVSEIVASIASDVGVELHAMDSAAGFVEGCVVGGPSTVRNDIELLLETDQLLLKDSANGLKLSRVKGCHTTKIQTENCAITKSGLFERSHLDLGDRLRRFNVNYRDRLADYDISSVFHTANDQNGAVGGINLPLTIDQHMASRIAQFQIDRSAEDVKTIKFALPPSQLRFEVGDVVALPDDPDKYIVTKIFDGESREITAVRAPKTTQAVAEGELNRPLAPVAIPSASDPVVYVAQVPPDGNEETRNSLVIGAFAKPWPGSIAVVDEHQHEIARLSRPASIGILKSILPNANRFVNWDTKTKLVVELFSGHLSSASKGRVIAGENRLLIQNSLGDWEEVGFANAGLIAANTYELDGLLRGLNKTEFAAASASDIGAPVIVLSDATTIQLDTEPIALSAIAEIDSPGAPVEFAGVSDRSNLPLAPAHLTAENLVNGDVLISWRRRGRLVGNRWSTGDVPLDSTPEQYTVSVLNDGSVARVVTTNSSLFTYPLAQQIADFGTAPSQFDFSVTQDSATLGCGHAATGVYI